MKFRLFLFSGLAFLTSLTTASAVKPASDIPPGPMEPSTATNAAPETTAPPQPNARSAPGAASPNGTNGRNLHGKPITKAPNTPTPTESKAPAPASTTTQAPAPKPPASVLAAYMQDLTDTLKLTPEEKNDIQTYYLDDGAQLQKILNDDTLSPLQQAQQVADLRDARNAKIDALLQGADRRHDFAGIEARYRVALTEFAANGGLASPQTPPAVPAPTETSPGQAEPIPRLNKPTDAD